MTEKIASSNKDSIKFASNKNIIGDRHLVAIRDRTDYADFASFDCMVRDRLSRKASISSNVGISRDSATRSKVSRLGVFNPVNHRDQLVNLTSVRVSNSLYESSKKYSLFFWLKAYMENLISIGVYKFVDKSVSYSVNIAQITKHLVAQVLVTNRLPRKGGVVSKRLYEYITRPRGRSPSPSFTMPSVANMGGMVMEDYLANIPQGREGYIYLIHAEGTNRYKIGRSVNPIVKVADIQKQAPYQLKIIASAWTINAPFDEAKLHKRYADWRVFGEWFELDQLLEGIEGHKVCEWETRLYAVSLEFEYLLPSMRNVANCSIKKLGNFLDCDLHSFYLLLSATCSINSLFQELSNREEVRLSQDFITRLLPLLVLDNCSLPDRNAVITEFSEPSFALWLNAFICGAIATFKVVCLNKGGAR